MSPWISPPSYLPAYMPFTPSNSEQRLLPTYCRGCWHVVSRSLFRQGRHRTRYWRALILPALKDFTIQRTFIVHAASLRQAFAHCGRFLAAASRRSLGRVSVPMWPVTLSGRLPIVALVGRYPTNKLMGRGLISMRQALRSPPLTLHACAQAPHPVLIHVSMGYPRHRGKLPTCYSPVRH